MHLMKLTHLYAQEGDCCDGTEQNITIETADGGAGHFIVISTKRWAIDPKEIDAFAAKLREVLKMAEYP